jgi:hypothetical protein
MKRPVYILYYILAYIKHNGDVPLKKNNRVIGLTY